MRENVVEKRFREKVEALGGLCLKWVCPGHAGVPDRIVLMPGGRIWFAELKAPGKKLEVLQRWWRDRLVKLGFAAREAVGKEGADALLEEIMRVPITRTHYKAPGDIVIYGAVKVEDAVAQVHKTAVDGKVDAIALVAWLEEQKWLE